MQSETTSGHPEFDASLATALSEQYGFRIYQAFEHRKVWRLSTTDGLIYLKKTKLHPAELNFIHEALEHLCQRGFPYVARYLLNRNGAPFTEVSGGRYVLTPWYNGMELNFQLLMDLKQATRLLAHFHLAGMEFEPSSPEFRTAWNTWPSKWEIRLRQLLDFRNLASVSKEHSIFSRLYLRYFELFYRQAQISYQRLLSSPYPQIAQNTSRQRHFCHHDYSGRNLLRTGPHSFMLIDFDYCLRDLRIHDLINLLVRNLKHLDWQTTVSRFILTEYHQVSPLLPEELQVMQIILSWPQDFWQLGLQYYNEKLPWPQERFIKKLESKIAQRFERERFLKEFSEHNGVYCWKETVL